MKNKEELSKTITELQKQLTIAQEQLKECEANSNKRWRAVAGCEYFYLDSFGVIFSKIESNWKVDVNRYCIGNYFKTRENAEEYMERLLAEQELLDMCDDVSDISWYNMCDDVSDISWNNKFSIIYNYTLGQFRYVIWNRFKYSKYYFSTKERAEEAIEKLGKEKLKLIFGVK